MYGVDLNPHTYQLIAQTADHVHWDTGEKWNTVQKGMSDKTDAAGGGHAHIGLMIYQGDNWPADYRHQLYTLNLHGLRINSNRMERQNAGYVGRRAPDHSFFRDPFFRGMDLVTGPDGGVYIADWSDTGECHDHDGVHRTSGRIYKLTYGRIPPQPAVDLYHSSNQELIARLFEPNAWWPRTARRILTERFAGKANEDLAAIRKELLDSWSKAESVVARLRVMETAYSIGAMNEEWLLARLESSDEHERVAAIRFLVDGLSADRNAPSKQLQSALVRQAANDPSGLVALYLASSMQRLPLANRWIIARELATKEAFRDDRMFPSMLWYGIEPSVPLDMAQAIELARLSRIPLLTENIARRIALEIEKRPEVLNQLLVSAESESFRHPERVVAGVAKALQGWQKATAPRNWESFVRTMTSNHAKVSSDVERDIQSLRLVFGDGRAVEELMKVIEDSAADPEARRQALRSLLTSRTSNDSQRLFKFLGDRILAREAIRGLAFYDHTDTPKQILNRIKSFGPGERAEMINTLASRGPFASALMQAIREKKIEPQELSAFHARQIRSFEIDALNRELSELWGDVRTTTEDKRQIMDELKGSMDANTLAKSDLRDGRAVFQKSCANCHVLFGAGTKV
ncbi:MAG: hypothetical protein ACK5TC_01830, partial [bacterium]